LVNVLSVLPWVTDSNYPCGVFKLLVNELSVLHSVSDYNYPCGYLQTFGKCIVCSPFSYRF
jgi:hypothetical protein